MTKRLQNDVGVPAELLIVAIFYPFSMCRYILIGVEYGKYAPLPRARARGRPRGGGAAGAYVILY